MTGRFAALSSLYGWQAKARLTTQRFIMRTAASRSTHGQNRAVTHKKGRPADRAALYVPGHSRAVAITNYLVSFDVIASFDDIIASLDIIASFDIIAPSVAVMLSVAIASPSLAVISLTMALSVVVSVFGEQAEIISAAPAIIEPATTLEMSARI
ncbi:MULTISPECIES: hypothetical protein [unclassified Sphingomonas]|uniref:hypothetical protein n=1 Tax=unclassified Sphingomonas TaxID=196159 RepID=UPI0035A87AD5